MGNQDNKQSDIDLTDVGGISQTLSADVNEIESKTSKTFNLYEEIRQRAEKGISEDISWSFDTAETPLSEIGIEDTTVPVLNDVERELHAVDKPDSVTFDSETVSEYVNDITSRIEEVRSVRSDLETRIESADQLSQQAFSDFVESTQLLESYDDPTAALEGSWGEDLEKHTSTREGRKETRRAIEKMTSTLKSEENSLQNELENVVNSYVSEAYDKAVDVSEELGGKRRPETGELDLLARIADSRAEIIQNRSDPDDYRFVSPEVASQKPLMDSSKRAMESQAALIAQMSSQLGQALEGSYEVVEDAEPYLDDSNSLRSSYESIEAMEKGFSEMGNIATDKCYDNLSEAVTQLMRHGMTEDEEFDNEYGFDMDGIPHIGSSEEEGGRL